MFDEKRKEMRFPAFIEISARDSQRKKSALGIIRDFSRDGIKAIFDNFNLDSGSQIDLKIHNPQEDAYFPATAEVKWRKSLNGKFEVGLKFRDFVPQVKADILEYCYRNWLKKRLFSTSLSNSGKI